MRFTARTTLGVEASSFRLNALGAGPEEGLPRGWDVLESDDDGG